MTYELKVAGLTRQLKLSSISDDLMIAGFVVFGDVELTVACARELLKVMPEYDYIIAPEAKAIPLIHEVARQNGRNEYLLARKAAKAYMDGVFSVKYESITTKGTQELFMDAGDARKMQGKRVVILGSGDIGLIMARMAVLAEGDAAKRDDIIFLEKLPLFNSKGEPLD